MKSPRCLLLIFLVLCALQHVAQAAGISTFSPQGEVARARQVRATFSEPVTGFGDPAAPAPFVVDCPGKGEGRWLDERRWVYDFERDLEPGLRCMFSLRPELKARSGAQFSGKTSFSFSTGGPVVVQTFPYAGDEVDEEQVFVLVQNGAATAASLLAHLYCEMEGVRERIPVKLIAGTVRDELLKRHAEDIDPQRISTVQCVQRFPSGAAMRLIWDKGIATTSGLATGQSQAYEYRVRPVFSASVKCERENANADCSPLLPLTLSFNSPVSRKLAQDVRIMGADGAKRKPWFGPGDNAPEVESIRFKPPFPAKSALTIELPRNLQDSAGRALANANQFPLKISMADYPPLAKFPAAPFGIVELDDHAALPVTLRNVEANLALRSVDGTAAPGMLSNLKIEGDAATIEWIGRLRQFHEKNVDVNGSSAESRSVGLLAREAAVKKLDLPVPQSGKDGSRPFEVVGIPLPAPGFYVLEIESQRLGTALLAKPAPMYVRTSALVTNLAVHVKLGRENSAVWVTALDSARPVAKADVRISDCNGKELWRGVTSADGVAMVPQALDSACSMDWERRPFEGLFVSARATDAKGRADMAFALTSWTEGIELFRFHVPTDTGRPATAAAHTVFDRTLLRTGETVSMKHFIRMQTRHGMGPLPERDLPDRLRIIHRGSAQEFRFPLAWHGQRAAHSEFVIPQQAKLGHYDVVLDSGPIEHSAANGGPADSTRQRYSSGSFRVEEFRLPLLQGRVTPPSRLLVMPNEIPFDVQLNYLNGGGAAG
ncbi:MAG: alpha-2-macroglobulin N-terminal region family protein, partial [Herminiimonas sp.]|nr:alpha-2-macroglobulin N-terminal region family protein [Herminiimonas sp.]